MIAVSDWLGIAAIALAATSLLIAHVRNFKVYVDAVYARKDDMARLEERMRAIEDRIQAIHDLTSEVLAELRKSRAH